MSFVLLGILNSQAAGGLAAAYRIQTLGGSGSEIGEAVAVDSVNNILISGWTDSTGAGGRDAFLAKYDFDGIIQWQRVLGGASTDESASVAVDSSDNVYFVGNTFSEGEGDEDILIAKYDTSGTLQWQRILGDISGDQAFSISLDASDNVYISGVARPGGANEACFVAKYNSSGALQWQRLLTAGQQARGNAVLVDSAGNVYVVGFATASVPEYNLLIAKYNSSGTIQWQRSLSDGSEPVQGFAVALDSSENLYISGNTRQGEGTRGALIAKYNSSGALQWQRILSGANDEQLFSLAVDSNDNIYLGGTANPGPFGSRDFLLAKYDSSGAIQYQRAFGDSSNNFPSSLALDSDANIYLFGGRDIGTRDYLLTVLPPDGSLTGIYVLDGTNIEYSATSLTAATSTLTSSASSLTASTPALTGATSTLTSASASLTEQRVDL